MTADTATRAVTAAAGLQPALISEVANTPEVPKVAADRMPRARPEPPRVAAGPRAPAASRVPGALRVPTAVTAILL